MTPKKREIVRRLYEISQRPDATPEQKNLILQALRKQGQKFVSESKARTAAEHPGAVPGESFQLAEPTLMDSIKAGAASLGTRAITAIPSTIAAVQDFMGADDVLTGLYGKPASLSRTVHAQQEGLKEFAKEKMGVTPGANTEVVEEAAGIVGDVVAPMGVAKAARPVSKGMGRASELINVITDNKQVANALEEAVSRGGVQAQGKVADELRNVKFLHETTPGEFIVKPDDLNAEILRVGKGKPPATVVGEAGSQGAKVGSQQLSKEEQARLAPKGKKTGLGKPPEFDVYWRELQNEQNDDLADFLSNTDDPIAATDHFSPKQISREEALESYRMEFKQDPPGIKSNFDPEDLKLENQTPKPDPPREPQGVKPEPAFTDFDTYWREQEATFGPLTRDAAMQSYMDDLAEAKAAFKELEAPKQPKGVPRIAEKDKPPPTEDLTKPPVSMDDTEIHERTIRLAEAGDIPQSTKKNKGETSFFGWWLRPEERQLRKYGGSVGRELIGKFKRMEYYQRLAEADAVFWATNQLSKLSKGDQVYLRKLVTKEIEPDSAAYKLVPQHIKDLVPDAQRHLQEVMRRAQQAGVQTVDGKVVQPLQDYWPSRTLDYDATYKMRNRAHATFDPSLQLHRGNRVAYDDNVAEAFVAYIRNAYQKIAEVREFGNKIDIEGYIKKASPIDPETKLNNPNWSGDDPAYIKHFLDKYFGGKDQLPEKLHNLMGGINNFVSGSMLAKSGPVNYTQAWYAAELYGSKHFLKAVGQISGRGKDLARTMMAKSGALSDTEVMSLTYSNAPLAKYAQAMITHGGGKFSKGSMASSEIWNRMVSGTTGLNAMEDVFKKALEVQKNLKTLPAGKRISQMNKLEEYKSQLKKHGVDVEGALKNGKMSHGDELNIMLIASDKAQHSTASTSLPAMWNTGGVFEQLVTKFQKYPLKHAWRLREDIGANKAFILKHFVMATPVMAAASAFLDVLAGENPLNKEAVEIAWKGLSMAFVLDSAIYRFSDLKGGKIMDSAAHLRMASNLAKGWYGILEGVFEGDPAEMMGAALEMNSKAFNVPMNRLIREIGKDMKREPTGSSTKIPGYNAPVYKEPKFDMGTGMPQ
jgi:hypothetical protein